MTAAERRLRRDLERLRDPTSALNSRSESALEAAMVKHASPLFVRERLLGYTQPRELCVTSMELWNELVRRRSARFASLLRRLVQSSDMLTAATAAEHLAWMGLDRDLGLLTRMLRSEDPVVVGKIAYGAGLAAYHRHSSQSVRAACFAALIPVLRGEKCAGRREPHRAARTLVVEAAYRLSPRAADKLLRSGECLSPLSPIVREIVLHFESLMSEGKKFKPIDPKLLWPIFDAITGRRLSIGDGFEDQVRGVILLLAAQMDPLRTRREANAIIKANRGNQSDPLSEAARHAIRRCAAIPEPAEALRSLQKRPSAFNPQAVRVLRVLELAEHVLSDGLPLYFHNLPESRQHALTGLKLLKLSKAAATLDAAFKVFVRACPPGGSRRVRAKFDQMEAPAREELERLGETFDGYIESINKAVERYVTKHPTDFAS